MMQKYIIKKTDVETLTRLMKKADKHKDYAPVKNCLSSLLFRATEQQDFELVKALLYYPLFFDDIIHRQAKKLWRLRNEHAAFERKESLYKEFVTLIKTHLSRKKYNDLLFKEEWEDAKRTWFIEESKAFQASPLLHYSMLQIEQPNFTEIIVEFNYVLNQNLESWCCFSLPRNFKEAWNLLENIQSELLKLEAMHANSLRQNGEFVVLGSRFNELKNEAEQKNRNIVLSRLEGQIEDYTTVQIDAIKLALLDVRLDCKSIDSETQNTLLQSFLLHVDVQKEGFADQSILYRRAEKNDNPAWHLFRLFLNRRYLTQEVIENENKQGHTLTEILSAKGNSFLISDLYFAGTPYVDLKDFFTLKSGGDNLLHQAIQDKNELLVLHLLARYRDKLPDLFQQNAEGKMPWDLLGDFVEDIDLHSLTFSPKNKWRLGFSIENQKLAEDQKDLEEENTVFMLQTRNRKHVVNQRVLASAGAPRTSYHLWAEEVLEEGQNSTSMEEFLEGNKVLFIREGNYFFFAFINRENAYETRPILNGNMIKHLKLESEMKDGTPKAHLDMLFLITDKHLVKSADQLLKLYRETPAQRILWGLIGLYCPERRIQNDTKTTQ